MKKNTFIIITTIIIWMSPTINADTIYTWRDENGVQKFSNEPPPQSVKNYKITESVPTDTNHPKLENKRRPSYDQMVKQASEETKAAQEQRKKEAEAAAAKKEQTLKKQQNDKRVAKLKRLKAQIEKIKKRAVSPTYPNGMKQAQIDALNNEINKLKNRPK